MKFQRIEFSWRAAFIGLYMTPERDKVWVTILPFFPLYFKRSEVSSSGAEPIRRQGFRVFVEPDRAPLNGKALNRRTSTSRS